VGLSMYSPDETMVLVRLETANRPAIGLLCLEEEKMSCCDCEVSDTSQGIYFQNFELPLLTPNLFNYHSKAHGLIYKSFSQDCYSANAILASRALILQSNE
jgi:hypothetical protein